METTMFALGILATIMVMFIAVVVVGTVKVFKMNKQIKELYTYIHEIERHWSDRLSDTHRDINMVEGTLRNGMEHYERVVNDQITDSVTQSNSYTDRRIDKLIDTYFEVQEAKQQSKRLIKG